MYCKYILGLKLSTSNCIIYKELGRYPVDIRIKTSIIAYWSRIVTCQKQNKLTSLLYETLYQLHTANIFHSKWLENVQTILNECGMTNVWQSQSEGIHGISTNWLNWLQLRIDYKINLYKKQIGYQTIIVNVCCIGI